MYRQHAENILTHPSLPPLIKGNSRLRQSSPSPDDWLWSPRHVLRWTQLYLAGSSQPHALIQHPYATRDVTFHVPLASLGSWGSVCQCLHAFSDVDGGPTEGCSFCELCMARPHGFNFRPYAYSLCLAAGWGPFDPIPGRVSCCLGLSLIGVLHLGPFLPITNCFHPPAQSHDCLCSSTFLFFSTGADYQCFLFLLYFFSPSLSINFLPGVSFLFFFSIPLSCPLWL